MSLTITHNNPSTELNPVYSPFYYRLTSNLSSEPDFNYVFTIHTLNQISGTESAVLATPKLPPLADGSGILTPARFLESYISNNDFEPFATGFTTNNNSLVHFKIKCGEEYTITGHTFSSTTDNSGFVQYNFNAVYSPAFVVGDVIKIEKSLKNINLDYDGIQTITNISGANVTTDKVFGIAYPNESGSCISRLTMDASLNQSGITINFARQYNEPNTSFANEYWLSGSNSKFLTDLSGDIRIGSNEYFTLSGVEHPTLSAVTSALIFTYDAAGAGLGVYQVNKTASPYKHFSFGCGTANLKNTYGLNILTLANEIIMSDNVKSYIVTLVNGTQQVAQNKTFVINDECDYNDVRIAWLNPRGGYSYQNFNYKYKRKVETNREFIRTVLPWNYEIGDRSEQVLSTKINTTLSLNTGYLTEAEGYHLESLYTSPQVFWLTASQKLPIVVLNKEFLTKNFQNDDFIQYNLEIRFAQNKILQRN